LCGLFALREAALRDKIQDLKERRKFYKSLLFAMLVAFIATVSYFILF